MGWIGLYFIYSFNAVYVYQIAQFYCTSPSFLDLVLLFN